MVILFSTFFWFFSFGFMALLAFATLAMIPFFGYPKIHSWIPAPGFSLIARVATLGKLKIVYDKSFDFNQRSVFCMNHTNLIDAHVASAAIPHAFCGLMNSWQFKVPFYGWLMKHSMGIPVNKKDRGKILEKMSEAAKVRKAHNMSILVFPEAHRTLDGTLSKFRRGVIFMARNAGYPVVPVSVKGMFQVNQKGSFLFHPGPVTVFVGSQIKTDGLTDTQIDQLTDDLYNKMKSQVEDGFQFQEKKVVNE